jgi:alpha-glucosidase
MPWTAADPAAGFSTGPAWLPVPKSHRQRAVAQQELRSDSALQRFRQFMAWRRAQPALRWGEIEILHEAEPVFAIRRRHAGQDLIALFNLSAAPSSLQLPQLAGAQPMAGHGLVSGRLQADRAELPGYGLLYVLAR